MNKKVLIPIALVILVVLAFYGRSLISTIRVGAPSATSTAQGVQYVNNDYRFSIALPQDWNGYSVVTNTWGGDVIGQNGDTPKEHGPLILIRNPKWTQQNPYQDIPIMVFTTSQWNDMQADKFHIGAAPINPSELGRNANYVFALPARYNYAFPAGYEEVDAIIQSHPLQAF